jgi:hypothetical protein
VNGSGSGRKVRFPSGNQGQQGTVDYLSSGFQRWIAPFDCRAVHTAGVAIQARTKERTNPVETARWIPRDHKRDMTQSDLVGNDERLSEMAARQAKLLGQYPEEIVADLAKSGESNSGVDTLVVHAVNVGH